MKNVLSGEAGLVSVIIPTYNRADTICHSLESALQQSYRNTEIIVVDDGSTDDTASQLARYGSRIRVIAQNNAGPSAARNRGIREARGDLAAFLDSDDVWLPTKIERQVALMRKAGESVPCCVCNATLQFTNRAPLDSFQNSLLTPCAEEGLWLNAAQVLLDRFLLFNQTGMIRRWALEKTGGFDESLRHMEDYDLALRLSLLGPFAFVASPLVVYNGGSAGSLTEEALGNVGRIKENVLKIRQRISQTVMASNRHTELRLPMHRSLRKARRELWVAQLRHRRIPGAAIMSHYLARAEHYFGAVVDRSPWFEKMKTVTICGNPLRPENPCDATRTREFVQ